jgi:hypothetical protein
VGRLDLLCTLRARPGDLCARMASHVYPVVAGDDHAGLLYYYSLLHGAPATDAPGNTTPDAPGNMTPDAHIKLIKRLRVEAAGSGARWVVQS